METVICDYCGQKARLVKGSLIYPKRPDLHRLNFYYCDNDHDPAYVGCHKGRDGRKPLGRLADAELRYWKSMAHSAFDPLWKKESHSKIFKTRSNAYSWLSKALKISGDKCHIGMFDIEQCKQVAKICLRIELDHASRLSAKYS